MKINFLHQYLLWIYIPTLKKSMNQNQVKTPKGTLHDYAQDEE